MRGDFFNYMKHHFFVVWFAGGEGIFFVVSDFFFFGGGVGSFSVAGDIFF